MDSMASPSGKRPYSLKTKLYEQIYSFDFHQVIRLMEAFTPDCTPLGTGVDPNKEAIRIKSKIDFVFAKADLDSLARPDLTKPMEQKPQLYINFLGLAGIAKPLPTPYGSLLYQRIRRKDTAGRDFLDIFNHRFSSILYRIHKKFRVELANTPLEESIFGRTLSAVAGVYRYLPSTNNRLNLKDRSVLGLAAYFWKKPHSAAGLEKILTTYFHLPFQVEQFIGHWVKAEVDQWTRLGTKFNTLGQSTVLGTQAWDQHGGIKLHLGPIEYKMLLSFLPGEVRCKSLRDLVRLYTGNLIRVQTQFCVKADTIPEIKLGTNARLGHTSWLHANPLTANDTQVKIDCGCLE